MADIQKELNRIMKAIYGEEVRGSIHDAISAMNEESTNAERVAISSRDSAKNSAAAAKVSEGNAANSATASANSAAASLASQNAAKVSENNSLTHENNAKTAQAKAETAQSKSEAAQKASENARDRSASSAAAALDSQKAAKTSETNAANSATASANSATASANSAKASADSASAALASQDAAKTSETNAANSAAAALASQNAAKTSETNAANSAAAALDSQKAAEAAQDVAVNLKKNIEQLDSSAAASAKASADSAAAALASQNAAKTSADNSANSATAANNAKKAAEAAQTAAENAEAGAQTAQSAAEKARDAASDSATASQKSADASANSATGSAGSAQASANSAAASKASADNAAASASAAAKSKSDTDTAATNAKTDINKLQTDFNDTATAATKKVNDAATAGVNDINTALKNDKNTLDSYKTAASNSATAAANSATAASNSATAAAGSASTAKTQADRAKSEADRATNVVGGIKQMKGATASADGDGGYVPIPAKGSQNKYLAGDATYKSPHAADILLSDGSNLQTYVDGDKTSGTALANQISAVDAAKLNKSGGTMGGTAFISWPDTGNWANSNSGVTFPVKRGGLSWSGQSDGIQVYAEETGKDDLELILQFTDDNSNGLTVRNASGATVGRLQADGYYTGKSATAGHSDSAGNITGVVQPDHGGTGQTSLNAAGNAIINSLTEGTSDPVDGDYYVAQYAGGGTKTTTYHRRPVSALWNYIKGKISSVLGLTKDNYGGTSAVAVRLIGMASGGSGGLSWGNQTGTAVHYENDTSGGSFGFRRDNPKAGQMSMVIDGTVYVNEGTKDLRYPDWSDVQNKPSVLTTGGGTLTGPLNTANGTANVIGDDVQIGDHNVGGSLGVQGRNANTKISLLKYGAGWGTVDAATIEYNGSQLVVNKTINGNITGSAGSAGSVAWGNVSGRPQVYTWDNGYIGNTTDWNGLTKAGSYKVQMASWGDGSTYHSPNRDLGSLYSFGILFVFWGTYGDGENRVCQLYLPHNTGPNTWAFRWNNSGSGFNGWNVWRWLSTDTNTWRPVDNSLSSTATDHSLSAAQGKALNDKFGSYVPKSGATMTGQLITSFKNAVATGSYQASATTIPNLINEVRYSSGCMGSVNIASAWNGIPASWYNFLYIPHRSGGANGAAVGDNCIYGTLLLFGMTISDQGWAIEYRSGSITNSYNLYYPSTVLDYNDKRRITFSYSSAGMNSTNWLASWDGSQLRAIAPGKAIHSGRILRTMTLSKGSWSSGKYSLEGSYPASSWDIEEVQPTGTKAQVQAFANAIIVGSSSSNVLQALGTIPTVDIPVMFYTTAK